MGLIDTIKALAITVRNEKKKEANSAVRIGDLFIAIIDYIFSTEKNNKGYKSTPEKLKVDFPVPERGWYAYVGETNSIWEVTNGQWVDSGNPIPTDVDLSNVALKSDIELKSDKTSIYNVSQITDIFAYETKKTARNDVPLSQRGRGQIISYRLATGEWITERYIGNSFASNDNDWWNNNNWEIIETGAKYFLNVSNYARNDSFGGRGAARVAINFVDRQLGQIITYRLDTGQWITERHVGNSVGIDQWQLSANWKDVSDDVNFGCFNLSKYFNKSFTTRSDARKAVSINNRSVGQILIYTLEGERFPVKEQYIGVNTYDSLWNYDDSWVDMPNINIGCYNLFKDKGKNYIDKFSARSDVKYPYRAQGLIITYKLNGKLCTEQYIYTSESLSDWVNSDNWINLIEYNELNTVSNDVFRTSTQRELLANELHIKYDSDVMPVFTSVKINNDIYTVLTQTVRVSISILKNFKRISGASYKNTYSIGSYAICELNGDIIFATNSLYNQTTKSSIYRYSISENKISLIAEIDFGVDQKKIGSLINYNNIIYFDVSYVSTAGAKLWDKGMIELYKLEGASISKVSTIATPDDVWGYELKQKNGSTTRSLSKTAYINSSLSLQGNRLYCTYIGAATPTAGIARNLAFTKFSDNLTDWKNFEILNNAKSGQSYYLNIDNESYYVSRAYYSTSFLYVDSEINICKNGLFNKGYLSHTPIIKELLNASEIDVIYSVTEMPDSVLFSYGAKDRNKNAVCAFLIEETKESIADRLNGRSNRIAGSNIKNLNKLNIGDSVILTNQGVSDIPIQTIQWLGSTETEYAIIKKNETLSLIYNGSRMGYVQNQLNKPNAIFSNIPYLHNAQHNAFQSKAFRIPCLTHSEDDNILYTAADIRYTTGADFDIINVGFCRSLDNGTTWQDYRKIFIRDENGDYSNRIHDCSLLVDKNPNSPHYGRIWAFAKMYTSDNEDLGSWDKRYIKLFRCYSDDKGLTWTPQEDVSSLIPDKLTIGSTEWDILIFGTGCNQGITMIDGTLVLPFYVGSKENTGTNYYPRLWSTFLYSNDNGNKWLLGDIVPDKMTNENSIVQLETGELVMNTRYEWDFKRFIYKLNSIGDGWTKVADMPSVTCNGSMVYKRGVYLFSIPEYKGSDQIRSNIAVYKSKDLIKWEKLVQVQTGESGGYSNIVLTDDSCSILFEDVNNKIKYTNMDSLLPLIYR